MQLILYAYDPEIVVLGGALSEALPLFDESMRETLRSFKFQSSLADFQVTATENRSDAGVLGAVALCVDSLADG